MANRRLGGGIGGGMGGGPQRGNRSFSQHQPFQGNNVSPWQGPSNNSLNQGLLGQIATNPQQLALALTNLLQPQQQPINNPPPSLLSLNTSPAFSHQDRDSLNRFNRGRSDFRRNEPYNKNRNGGWRPMDKSTPNRGNRGSFGGRDRRRSPPNRQQRNARSNEERQQRNKSIEDKPQAVAKEAKEGKEGVKADAIDLTAEYGRDEEGAEETKRGWKEEKNVCDEKLDTDADDLADEEDDKNQKDESGTSKNLDGKYYGVPQSLLHCFVCNKDMWDGESFEKHVRGRAHKQMLQSLEESFHITVNILRENMRLTEEKKVIELNRMHRLSKNKYSRKFQEPESHCNMCDLKFLGKIIAHRKTEGHQRLKRFLHPNCDICTKEFPSRMDWVDHKLTPEHLRKLNEMLENKVGGEDGAIIEQNLEADLEPILQECWETEDDHPILELSDDLGNLQNRIPAYKKNRALGTEQLKSFQGFMCDICNRSFQSDELAQSHLKTLRHYYEFIKAAKLKFKRQNEEAAEKEAEVRKRKRMSEGKEEKEEVGEEAEAAQNGNEDMYDPEEACKEEEEDAEMKVDESMEILPDNAEKDEEPLEEEEEEKKIEEGAVTAAAAATVVIEDLKKDEKKVEEPATNVTPRPRRNVARGGAGPKCKKLATKQEEKNELPEKSPVALSTFRIPKLGGTVKNGASPKFKK